MEEILKNRYNKELIEKELINTKSEILELKKQLKDKQIKSLALHIIQGLNSNKKDDYVLMISNLSSKTEESWELLIELFKNISLAITIEENKRLDIKELVVKYSTFDYSKYNIGSQIVVINENVDINNLRLKSSKVLLTNQLNAKDNGVYILKDSGYTRPLVNDINNSSYELEIQLNEYNNSFPKCRARQYHSDKEGNSYIYFPVIRYQIGYYNSYFSNHIQYMKQNKLTVNFNIVYDNNNSPVFCYNDIKFILKIYINYKEQIYKIYSFIEGKTKAIENTFKPKDKIELRSFLNMMINKGENND